MKLLLILQLLVQPHILFCSVVVRCEALRLLDRYAVMLSGARGQGPGEKPWHLIYHFYENPATRHKNKRLFVRVKELSFFKCANVPTRIEHLNNHLGSIPRLFCQWPLQKTYLGLRFIILDTNHIIF